MPIDTQDRFIEISADLLPSKSFSYEIRVPKYEDKQDANSRHPGQDSNCGYTSGELMFAACLCKVTNSKTGITQDFRELPIDVIDRISNIPNPDYQFLLTTFLPFVNLVDDEGLARAKTISDHFLLDPAAEEFKIHSYQFPTKSFSVTFVRPRAGNITDFRKVYATLTDPTYSFEEYMAARCLTHIDDEPIQRDKQNPVLSLRKWPCIDASFYGTVMMRVSTINDETREASLNLGKNLMASIWGNSSNQSTTSRSSGITPESIPNGSATSLKGRKQPPSTMDSSTEMEREPSTAL